MVTIKDYAIANNSEGNSFVLLILEGDLEMIQSQTTGRYYATTRKCRISSTFDETTASLMVGKQIPGSIKKIECEPYSYTVEETGEVISLSHRYEYVSEEDTKSSPKTSVDREALEADLETFSTNGIHELAEV